MTNNLTITGTYGDGDKVITLKMQNSFVAGTREYPNARMAEAELLAQFLDENLPAVTLIALASELSKRVRR